ncbi:hypothetical protein ACFSTH_12945 [Paenibacillus yanchengensis]|uniref:Uncharacterized protein n=1 Tax=Paenibacillus yanchengensis TaxID=2035833 RepID=A0ABW4YP98_9BACL
MNIYVTHYYKQGTTPFQSLSALSDQEALRVMEQLGSDSPLFARFKTPVAYWNTRKQVEQWLLDRFTAKGAKPAAAYPLYAVLGSSAWIEKYGTAFDIISIRISLTLFSAHDISFTYPDSMVSYEQSNRLVQQMEATNDNLTWQQSMYGQVFTLDEIQQRLANDNLLEQISDSELPEETAPYIEAQIWNHGLLNGEKTFPG